MRNRKSPDGKTADLHIIFQIHNLDVGARQVGEVLESFFNHYACKLPSVERRVAELAHYKRYRSYVVQVSVSYKERLYSVFSFFKICCVGYYVINTRRLFTREVDSGVYYNNVVIIFQNGHILPDLLYASKGYNSYYVIF